MTPEQLAAPGTELAHQTAFFCWLNQTGRKIDPRLNFAFAIPNGGERNITVAARMKQSGTKKGVPDIFIPIPKFFGNQLVCCGLWIELKRPKSSGKSAGRLDEEQEIWKAYLESQKYQWILAVGYLQAIESTLLYLGRTDITHFPNS